MMRRRGFGRRGRGAPPGEGPADPHAARLAALTLLARRDHAVAELRARLAEAGHAAEVIEPLLAALQADGSLDDARFAASYLAGHAQRGHGPHRIARELAERGVPPAVSEAALAEGPDWRALAREVRSRRFGPEPPADWPEKARQARFLQYRGFSSDHIRSALGPDFDPEDPT